MNKREKMKAVGIKNKGKCKGMVKNPNGYNQSNPDPRQALFLKNYIDPKSSTFGNCYRSGLEAGYSKEYSKILGSTLPTWLKDKLNIVGLVKKSEDNLKMFLSDEYKQNDKIKFQASTFVLNAVAKSWQKNSEDEVKKKMVNVEVNIKQIISSNSNIKQAVEINICDEESNPPLSLDTQ